MRALLVLLLALLPALAQAGAWPRARGEVYLQADAELGGRGWSGLYAEWGGPRDLTFGLAVGTEPAALREADANGRGRVFVRAPLPVPWREWRLAVEAGVGADIRTTEHPDLPVLYAPRLILGVSAGRGLRTPLGPGWVNADLRVGRRVHEPMGPVGPARRTVLDATLGVRPRDGHAVEMALHLEREGDGDTFAAVGPTWQRDLGRIGAARLGVAVTERGEARLRLGFVRVFGGAR